MIEVKRRSFVLQKDVINLRPQSNEWGLSGKTLSHFASLKENLNNPTYHDHVLNRTQKSFIQVKSSDKCKWLNILWWSLGCSSSFCNNISLGASEHAESSGENCFVVTDVFALLSAKFEVVWLPSHRSCILYLVFYGNWWKLKLYIQRY